MKSLFKRLLAFYHINEDDYRLLTMDVNEDNFASGHSFEQMDDCIRVVKEAINNHKKIMIYGDYDADGITPRSQRGAITSKSPMKTGYLIF